MNTLLKNSYAKVTRFLRSEDGPTTVEYAVILAVITILHLITIQAIGTNANTTFNSLANTIETGNASR